MARKGRPASFRGEVRVASRIIDYLSSGLYNSAAACLKELVNNSYDADATRVDVFVKPDSERIIIADDGAGMTRTEFQRHFEHVSESHKREDTDQTAGGRPKVGKIGIGFIAANELCDVMEIESTKQGSTELMEVTVNFAEMRRPPEERKRKGVEYVKADYQGRVGAAPRDAHYTTVVLRDVTPTARGIIADLRTGRPHTKGRKSIYGATPASVRELVADADDWGDFDEYSQTMLKVGLNVPVRYLPNWYPSEYKGPLGRCERSVKKLDFRVYCDGTDLRKPVVLDAGEANLLREVRIDGEHVAARGYFYAKRRVLRPQWLNGVLIRVRNAAVGEYDGTFLGFKASEQRLFQSWTTCELWADDRLEEALNIDRRTLRLTHPAYVELQEAFHSALSAFLLEARDKLYEAPRTERRGQAAKVQMARVEEIVNAPESGLSPRVRRRITATAREKRTTASTGDLSAALRKYDVADVYGLALDAARDVLPSSQYERFAQALAERLLR